MYEHSNQIDPIKEKILDLKSKGSGPILIGIDGRCASGKTTLAEELARTLDCEVIHADDFYLRKEQRTISRLKEPGGNFDRERMIKEVFGPLHNESSIQYRTFDCSTMLFTETHKIQDISVLIIEGAYSLHPSLREFYDLKIFVDIDPIAQHIRICRRNGHEWAEVFQYRWIPLEEKYIEACDVKSIADIIL